MTFGERVKELRKRNGLSQEQLADKLNVSRQSVQKWESNINDPSIDALKSIANYFKVDYEYLLNGEEKQIINNENNIIDKKENKGKVIKENNYSFTPRIILYIILLIFCLALLLVLLFWALKHPFGYNWSGLGFYNWYIPVYWDDLNVVIFQILNMLGIAGIILSIIKILKGDKKRK